jgi:hypothetical protein
MTTTEARMTLNSVDTLITVAEPGGGKQEALDAGISTVCGASMLNACARNFDHCRSQRNKIANISITNQQSTNLITQFEALFPGAPNSSPSLKELKVLRCTARILEASLAGSGLNLDGVDLRVIAGFTSSAVWFNQGPSQLKTIVLSDDGDKKKKARKHGSSGKPSLDILMFTDGATHPIRSMQSPEGKPAENVTDGEW